MIRGIADWHQLFSHSDHFCIYIRAELLIFIIALLMTFANIPDVTPTTHGWFWGWVALAFLMWILIPLSTWQSQQPVTFPNVELGQLPSFVNPDLVQAQLDIPTSPHIDFPPAAHVRQ